MTGADPLVTNSESNNMTRPTSSRRRTRIHAGRRSVVGVLTALLVSQHASTPACSAFHLQMSSTRPPSRRRGSRSSVPAGPSNDANNVPAQRTAPSSSPLVPPTPGGGGSSSRRRRSSGARQNSSAPSANASGSSSQATASRGASNRSSSANLSNSNTSTSNNGVTSTLISKLAVIALKLRLQTQTSVACDVTASSSDLFLKQQVGPVTVRGKSWSSPLGLTCRAIEATVQTCDLDMGSVISRQKLVLTTPARGEAMVALDAVDFANFIDHPLMRPPVLVASSADDAKSGGNAGSSDNKGTDSIEFVKDGTSIDPTTGTVTFHLTYADTEYRCELKRGPDASARALIDVYPSTEFSPADIRDETSRRLTETISNFFNDLVFELDGTFLTFRDMMVTEKGGGDGTVMLKLDITVKKFPSPGLAF